MAGDISEVIGKLKWSRHQLSVLNLAITDYIDLDPYMAIVKDDPETESYRVIAKLRYPPPASVSHIVGDVLNSLHGVLDYLAWQLVIREGQVPDARAEFPIVKTANEDGSEPPVNIYRTPEGKSRGREAVINDKAVLAMLRDVQPYRDGDRANFHPLQILRELNRESKHRHPVVLATASVSGGFMTGSSPGRTGAIGDALIVTHRRVGDGDEFVQVAYTDAPNGCNPEKASFTPQVSLEGIPADPGADPRPLWDLLAEIYAFVESRVVGPLSLFF
jgi:hypothetical protein